MKTLTFTGMLTGDGDAAFLTGMTKEEAIRIFGEEAYNYSYKLERNYAVEQNEEHPNHQVDPDSFAHFNSSQMYLNTICDLLECEKGKKYKFTITREEVHD